MVSVENVSGTERFEMVCMLERGGGYNRGEARRLGQLDGCDEYLIEPKSF